MEKWSGLSNISSPWHEVDIPGTLLSIIYGECRISGNTNAQRVGISWILPLQRLHPRLEHVALNTPYTYLVTVQSRPTKHPNKIACNR